ncbi:uncharacterized protein [Nicotiana tomentosiformis]|uniref:uncharacterized protein n=1 Tax=Nicotiana tomentosiformis TaxID=4098 RepID=UPI00388C6601
MPEDNKRRLERFGKLQPPPFSGTEREDAQDFLDMCQRILRTAGFLEWWETYERRRPIGAAPLTWQQFSVVFLEKLVPRPAERSCRDSLCGFARFQHGRGHHFKHAQSALAFHRGASSGHRSHSSHQGHSSFGALPAQSSARAPSVQVSSMPGSSASYLGARGSLQLPPPAPRSYFECREFGHMWRQCPHRHGGLSQQRSQTSTSAPITSPPAQSARGEGQSGRGRPRGGGRSGGGQAHFYALPARPNVIVLDGVITGSVSVCYRDASAGGVYLVHLSLVFLGYQTLKVDGHSYRGREDPEHPPEWR